tara:strand:+ start:258 stop:425 length:168 start_codon:yes stop_codon:yes gene_type:complete
MRKNSQNRETFIDEFRKKVGNRYFLRESGKWVEISLGVQPFEQPVHKNNEKSKNN